MKIQDELFSAAEIQECAREGERIEAEKRQEERRKIIEAVQLPYFEQPKDDNERLLNWQHDFLKKGDLEAKKRMESLGWEVLQRILWSVMKKRRLYISRDRQTDIVLNAWEYIFRRYRKDNAYFVSQNYISALKSAVIHALDYRTSKDTKETGLSDGFECGYDSDPLKEIYWRRIETVMDGVKSDDPLLVRKRDRMMKREADIIRHELFDSEE